MRVRSPDLRRAIAEKLKGTRGGRPLAERWLEKVEIGEDGCWWWRGGLHHYGYGVIQDEPPSRKQLGAHVVSYRLFKGVIARGLEVRHSCHNRACVNPSHLSLGTKADNVRDRDEAGRTLRGERHWAAKLSEADVLSIRTDDRSNREIADSYGMTKENVMHIRKRKTWKHL